MHLLPAELAILVSILITTTPVTALPHVSHRDAQTLPCTGEFTSLNTNGLSPGSVYQQLQTECNNPAQPDASVCRCNIVAYNLNQASNLCQQNPLDTWPEWANANQCTTNATNNPPSQVPYNTSAFSIPKWASEDLATNMTFNELAVMKQAKSGWSPIQIATPIIVGVGVIIIAAIAFFVYRRHQTGYWSKPRPKAWRSAHLRGNRRFGLIPEVFRVKSRKNREPQWEIDGNVAVDPDFSPSSHDRAESSMSMHSRTTSVTSLLSGHSSSPSSAGRGIFASLASKFSAFSLRKDYQIGTSKGPDYKRVQVLTGSHDERFRIDGAYDGLASPAAARNESSQQASLPSVPEAAPTPTAPPQSPTIHESVPPSVFDIRHHSSVGGGTVARTFTGTRTGTMSGTGTHIGFGQVPSELYDMDDAHSLAFAASPRAERSDYSLSTADLQTPVTPSRDAGIAAFSPPHRSIVSPGSPLLTSARTTRPLVSPSAFSPSSVAQRRNQSTDSLAYELYPRQPR